MDASDICHGSKTHTLAVNICTAMPMQPSSWETKALARTVESVDRKKSGGIYFCGARQKDSYFIAVASDAEVHENASKFVDISNEWLNQKDRAFAATCDTLESTIKAQQQGLGKLMQVVADRDRFVQEATRLEKG